MSELTPPLSSRQLWQTIRTEVERAAQREPLLASFYHSAILAHSEFVQAVSCHLAAKLDTRAVPALVLQDVFEQALRADSDIVEAIYADIRACFERDPACDQYAMPLLYFKGFHALQSYRVAHWLWLQGRCSLALYLQNVISQVFDVDIHPAAVIGRGILIDHATGVVVGETCVIEDDVSMLHSVTLGGSGCSSGDRHPKIRRGVLIAVGAKVLGNIEVGEGAKIAGGSVVLEPVPAHTTVAGVPAVVVGAPRVAQPALEMDHRLNNGS